MDLDTPLAEAGTAAPPPPRWVVFTCGERRYAVALAASRELLAPRPFTRLPGTGPEVAGLIGVRSRVVTTFDLGVLLADRPSSAQPDHRVLLVDHDARVRGLVVDAVLAVTALTPGVPRQAAAGLTGWECAWEGSSVLALDVEEVCERLLASTAA